MLMFIMIGVDVDVDVDVDINVDVYVDDTFDHFHHDYDQTKGSVFMIMIISSYHDQQTMGSVDNLLIMTRLWWTGRLC